MNFKKYLGEGLLIVFSVLFALFINKTYEDAKTNRVKKFTSKQIIKSITEEPESRKEWLLFMFERAAKKYKRNKTYQLWTNEPRRAQRS